MISRDGHLAQEYADLPGARRIEAREDERPFLVGDGLKVVVEVHAAILAYAQQAYVRKRATHLICSSIRLHDFIVSPIISSFDGRGVEQSGSSSGS